MEEQMRTAQIERKTKETEISLKINLDGLGISNISTGIGFLDHILTLLSAHSFVDMDIQAKGDLHVDGHHLTEDIGIALGQAFVQALRDKKGIRRYGHFALPMDETLISTAIDFGGRPHFVFNVEFNRPKIGDFDTELINEFWQGFAMSGLCNLHIQCHYGTNSHHIAEGIFKCVARSIRNAVEPDPRQTGVPSTKGVL